MHSIRSFSASILHIKKIPHLLALVGKLTHFCISSFFIPIFVDRGTTNKSNTTNGDNLDLGGGSYSTHCIKKKWIRSTQTSDITPTEVSTMLQIGQMPKTIDIDPPNTTKFCHRQGDEAVDGAPPRSPTYTLLNILQCLLGFWRVYKRDFGGVREDGTPAT